MTMISRVTRHDLLERVQAACLFLGSAATGLAPSADGDIFWHLAAGREMVRTHALIRQDVFSISALGRPWIDVHWLFQLTCYALHAALGLRGLVLVKCTVIGLSARWLCAGVPRSARPLTAAGLIGWLWCARQLLLLRPVIVSLLLLALFFRQLEHFRRDGRAQRLWILPFAQVVWSNCQGLFALGPALVGAYALAALLWHAGAGTAWYPFAPECAGSDRVTRRQHARTLWLVLACTLLATLATPYGVRALGLPFELLARLWPRAGNPYRHVAENVPPFELDSTSGGEFWHFKWFLGMLALALAANGGRVRLSHLFLLVGVLGLAWISNRNVLLLYFMATPLAALQLTAAWRRTRIQLPQPWRRAVWPARALFMALLAQVGVAAARESTLAEPTPFHVPVEGVAAIAAHGGSGAIFCADHYGGYVIWKLHPQFRPFIDTRLILRTAREYADYLALADEPERFDALQSRQAFDYALLPVMYPDRYLPLVAHLYASSSWRLVYTDGTQVLFARSALAKGAGWDLGAASTTDHVLAQLAARFSDPQLIAAARLQLATLQLALSLPQQAVRVLEPMNAQVGHPQAAARGLLARAHLLAGDLDRAETLGGQLLGAEPRDVHSIALLAQVSLRRGQLRRAHDLVRRAVALDPFDAEVTSLLAAMEEPHEP